MYQDDRLQELLWMNRCVDTSSFYISKWRDQVGRLAKGRDGKEKKSCKRIPVSIDR